MNSPVAFKDFADLDFARLPLKISTERYHSPEWQEKERRAIWMKTWQIVGRADELPNSGDYKVYSLLDQSWIVARGQDGKLRGFVNACRHRGNALCEGKGHAGRFTCQYHMWTYGLDGRLLAVARPDLVPDIDKAEHTLVEVPVDTFAGFIFLNPDRDAQPLAEFMTRDVMEGLAPYKLDEMTPVGMDVREELDCNWKVVMDAFSEGYHILGVHPELLAVIDLEPAAATWGFYGDHRTAGSPFEVKNADVCSVEQQVEAIRSLPSTFPSVAEVLPTFEAMIAPHLSADGTYAFPAGESVRTILQKATRQTLTAKGMDVSGLTDDQMSDSRGWFFFPNFFMTIRAGEATTILMTPHPSGDPNKCIWHVTAYMWLPEPLRQQYRAELVEVKEKGSYPYFLALQQDYDQMERQQRGLRNEGLTHISLSQEEFCVAQFHANIDKYVSRAG
ncbi:MAG: aromatic ring-hydroxylating dioxygenase subunit alpha [Sphingomonadales bacterium]|nr:aromatic ring-hydroxylating dioxygenase subunit alpha [Sphingomonadales bacterium]